MRNYCLFFVTIKTSLLWKFRPLLKIEKEELEKYIEEVFIKEKEKLQIKGFRTGQAPEEIAKDFISKLWTY